MRSLFLKVLVGFWLTVILVGVTLEFSTFMMLLDEEQLRARALATLPTESKKAASVFEASGAAGLAAYLADLERRESVSAYFLDEAAVSPLRREPPATVLAIAKVANVAQDDRPVIRAKDQKAAQRAAGPSGRQYLLVLSFPRDPMHAVWRLFDTNRNLRFLAVLVVGGLFCLWLTRHIAVPLAQLRTVASSIASGHLDARVGPRVLGRHDEIALLGRDFNSMAERIESLITSERRMLGDVSHELRSPLARLILSASLARKCPTWELPEYLDRIELEAHRLDTLIGQLLTLARINSEVDASSGTTFDLAELVHEVAADGDFEGRGQQKAVRVVSSDPCEMTGIAELVRSAVENVVRNGIRHTTPGTAVDIVLERRDGPEASTALLRVRDHGPGVPDEMLREIFLPFRRASGTPHGAGLGLAITARVVEMFDGTVSAANAPGGGLVVEMELPLAGRAT